MRRHGYGVSVFAAIVLCCLFFHFPAQADENVVSVRVGYYEDGDYMSRGRSSEYIGFNIEFLQKIAKFGGMRYEMVDEGSWENAWLQLVEGRIDMLPAVFRTEDREKEVLFSNLPMGTLYVTLNVRADDKRYGYEDFESFQGMKVGVVRGSGDGESFQRYCEKFGVKPIIVPYAETRELLAALENGTLDGVAITHLGRGSTFRSVAQFSPEPVYIAVAKNRPDLLARLDAAMNAIVLRDPNYMMRLYDKYFAVSTAQQAVFTKEEYAFLKEADVIIAAYDPSWAPLEYTDPETGMFSGVTADLLAMFSKSTGLRFRFEPIYQAEALEKLRKGQIDLVCSVTGDYLWDERNNMYTTRYYLRAPTMLVRSKQPHAIERIALQGGYWFSEHVAADNPGKEIIFYNTVRECFDALLKGDADAAYANVYVTNYLLAERRYESLAATSLSKYTSEICFGISKCADPRLFSILDKSIQYTAAERMDELVLKNTTKPRQITLLDFVAQHLVEVGCSMLAVFGVILLLLGYNLIIKTKSNHRIQALLYRDGLTNLDNMNKFYVDCGRLLQRAPSGSYALLYGDINQFKTINDNLGFAVGDQILQAFGAILQRNIKDGECCARASADHFILLLRYAEWESLLVRIEEIGMQLDEWRRKQDMAYRIVTVFGVYLVNETEGLDVHRMLDFANYARRNAKQTAKYIVLYDEKMRQEALLQRELEGRLEIALGQGEFEAYFQPKVDMRDGALIGSEALVRWNHPTRGLLMPGSFIPFFERNGSVVEVDLYIYELVCRTVREWLDRGMTVNPVSCNFSSLHFDSPDFPELVTAIADRHDVPHALLELELTESAIMRNPQIVCAQVLRLKERGFMIAIDDFGSGYSSLGQLQQLMADVLKLDRSFVRRGMFGTRERIVIGNVIHMAGELGMQVICEGVENAKQAEMLIELGCYYAQGFYYAKPMPRKVFEGVLEKGKILQDEKGSSRKTS